MIIIYKNYILVYIYIKNSYKIEQNSYAQKRDLANSQCNIISRMFLQEKNLLYI